MVWRTNKKGQHYQPVKTGIRMSDFDSEHSGIIEHRFKKPEDFEVNEDELELFAKEKANEMAESDDDEIESIDEVETKPRMAKEWDDPILKDIVARSRTASRLSLDRLVRLPDGNLTSIKELADHDMLEFKKTDNFLGKGNKVMTKYFADLKGTNSGWEINETAYLSRTGQKEKLQGMFE